MQQRTIESIDNSDQTDLISHAGLVTRCSEKKKRTWYKSKEQGKFLDNIRKERGEKKVPRKLAEKVHRKEELRFNGTAQK